MYLNPEIHNLCLKCESLRPQHAEVEQTGRATLCLEFGGINEKEQWRFRAWGFKTASDKKGSVSKSDASPKNSSVAVIIVRAIKEVLDKAEK